MPELPDVIRHERLPATADGAHRWRVSLAGREAIEVHLPDEERGSLELSDEELHELLPTALNRAAEGEPHDLPWDEPVRLYADHFRG